MVGFLVPPSRSPQTSLTPWPGPFTERRVLRELLLPPSVDFHSVDLNVCRYVSNIDQLFGEHDIINQMVATPTGVRSGRRFTPWDANGPFSGHVGPAPWTQMHAPAHKITFVTAYVQM